MPLVLAHRNPPSAAGLAAVAAMLAFMPALTPVQAGPNLTDNRWLWSDGSSAGIAATIRVGVPHPKNYRAPMPAMGGAQLTADQVSALAAYVWALSQPTGAAH